jgi:SAM-dependent methyltransferase
MPEAALPLPPRDLAARVGTHEQADPIRFYLDEGLRLRGVIEQLLPPAWEWEGKRALDFGCGAARVLRQFEPEARRGDFYGCDIDRVSVDWDVEKLSPPFHFFHSQPAPPLPLGDGSLDLVWAMSVFTHIGRWWSGWLAELHRVLDTGGVVIASFLGEPMWEALLQEPYVENEVGMAVVHDWEGPDAWVFHSEWWLREHWGRAFEVLAVERPPRGPDGALEITHGYVVLRKLDADVSVQELERIDPSEVREIAGLQTQIRLLHGEVASNGTHSPRPWWRDALPTRAQLRRLSRRLR